MRESMWGSLTISANLKHDLANHRARQCRGKLLSAKVGIVALFYECLDIISVEMDDVALQSTTDAPYVSRMSG